MEQLFQKPISSMSDMNSQIDASLSLIDANVKKEIVSRHIILHYHLFKNAGTSVDKILKANFGSAWREKEGAGSGWLSEQVAVYLQNNPEIQVLSSHTALMPVPVLPECEIFPIIFLRHPIDRVRSIYEFERKQQADTEGAKMAKRTDIQGFVRWRLGRNGDRAIRNFQCYRLALAYPQKTGEVLAELERAKKALDSLPFVGLVENFDKSILELEKWLKPYFPSIQFKSIKENVTQKEGSNLNERLMTFRKELGDVLYEELLVANQADVSLYETVIEQYKVT